MTQVRMTILLAAGIMVLLGANQLLAQEHFNDGDTRIIDYEIDDRVHIDDGEAYAETKTTVNIVEGGSIPRGERPYNYLRAYNQSIANISGGEVYGLAAYDSSTVDISGGNIAFGPLGLLTAYDSTTVAISGGEVSRGLVAYDSSTVDISGGSVNRLGALDSSTVDISGGEVGEFRAWDSSTVDISGGEVSFLNTRNSSTVDISGGEVDGLGAGGSSTVDISGGSVDELGAWDRSTVTLIGYDFEALDGLELDEVEIINGVPQYEVTGTGTLKGTWFGETESWTIDIGWNDETATIMAIPEPATLALLGLGGLVLLRRRHNA